MYRLYGADGCEEDVAEVAWVNGSGAGPLNHFQSVQPVPLGDTTLSQDDTMPHASSEQTQALREAEFSDLPRRVAGEMRRLRLRR
eukprot:3497312-Rhodomonas_salina.1